MVVVVRPVRVSRCMIVRLVLVRMAVRMRLLRMRVGVRRMRVPVRLVRV